MPEIPASTSGAPPSVAVGTVEDGQVVPQVPMAHLFDAQIDALRREHDARLQALREQIARDGALGQTQATALSNTVADSARVLEQRVGASAAAAAGAVEQTRVAFERSIDRTAEAALTNVVAVRREMELRDDHAKELTAMRVSLQHELLEAHNNAIRERMDLIRSSHADEHTRIREIGVLADSVRSAKDASQNEWRGTVEAALSKQVTSEVLQAKLDGILQRIDLSDRTTQDRQDRSEKIISDRLADLEKARNEGIGGRDQAAVGRDVHRDNRGSDQWAIGIGIGALVLIINIAVAVLLHYAK